MAKRKQVLTTEEVAKDRRKRIRQIEKERRDVNAKAKIEIEEWQSKKVTDIPGGEPVRKQRIKEIELERKAFNAKAKRELMELGRIYAERAFPLKKEQIDAGCPHVPPCSLCPTEKEIKDFESKSVKQSEQVAPEQTEGSALDETFSTEQVAQSELLHQQREQEIARENPFASKLAEIETKINRASELYNSIKLG